LSPLKFEDKEDDDDLLLDIDVFVLDMVVAVVVAALDPLLRDMEEEPDVLLEGVRATEEME